MQTLLSTIRPCVGSLALLCLLAAGDVTAAVTRVSAESMRVVRGTASNQGISALRTADQSGYVDDWPRYVEFSTGSRGFRANFEFYLPVDLVGLSLDTIRLATSFRGPERDEQLWRWSIRNTVSGRWSRLGDNRGIPDWRWTRQRFAARGQAADYVDALGRVRIRLVSPLSGDDANLDALTLEIEPTKEQVPVTVVPVPQEPVAQAPVAVAPTPAQGPVSLPASPDMPPLLDVGRWQPTPGTSWQIQYTGALNTSLDVDVYNIDLFDTPRETIDALHAEGRAVICYFSAGSFENWRPDAARFDRNVLGNPLSGWPGERWLDIRRLDVLLPIMQARMDIAVSKGCDAVDPDNVDGYSNVTGLPLTAAQQLTYNTALANAAHERGLAIGLKNDVEQVSTLEPLFDFAVNESCIVYNECDRLAPFIAAGKAVFGIEYQGDTGAVCSRANALDFDTLRKDRLLGAARESCR